MNIKFKKHTEEENVCKPSVYIYSIDLTWIAAIKMFPQSVAVLTWQ